MYSRVAALQSSRVISRVEGKKRGGVAELQLAAPSVGFCPPLPVGGRRQLLLLPVAVEVPVDVRRARLHVVVLLSLDLLLKGSQRPWLAGWLAGRLLARSVPGCRGAE